MLEDQSGERYSRLDISGIWDGRIIRKSDKKALIAGVGALGNEVAKNLAMIGFSNVFLVDKQKIELSNLTRSILFRESDVGLPKVEAAKRRMHEINSEVKIATFHGNLDSLGLGVFRRMDVVFCELDGIFPRLLLNRALLRVGTPWVNAGMGAREPDSLKVANGRNNTHTLLDWFCLFLLVLSTIKSLITHSTFW